MLHYTTRVLSTVICPPSRLTATDRCWLARGRRCTDLAILTARWPSYYTVVLTRQNIPSPLIFVVVQWLSARRDERNREGFAVVVAAPGAGPGLSGTDSGTGTGTTSDPVIQEPAPPHHRRVSNPLCSSRSGSRSRPGAPSTSPQWKYDVVLGVVPFGIVIGTGITHAIS